MRSVGSLALAACLLACAPAAPAVEPAAAAPDGGAIVFDVQPAEATVGDRLRATITVDLPPGTQLVTRELGPELGQLSVLDGAWRGPEPQAASQRWVWQGTLAAFRTGTLEIPPLAFDTKGPAGAKPLTTAARSVVVRSVLEPAEEGETPELADIKPPASLPPNYRPLYLALGLLGLLLLASFAAWWLHRRYARKLAAPVSTDLFQRVPPHEWAFNELQKLLDRRLAEQGEVDLFFTELARIVKLYLSGRYRVELMEQTTVEVPQRLRQAGAGETAIAAVAALLLRADRVKFARDAPDPAACRLAVEEAYRIVDSTKPIDVVRPADRGAA